MYVFIIYVHWRGGGGGGGEACYCYRIHPENLKMPDVLHYPLIQWCLNRFLPFKRYHISVLQHILEICMPECSSAFQKRERKKIKINKYKKKENDEYIRLMCNICRERKIKRIEKKNIYIRFKQRTNHSWRKYRFFFFSHFFIFKSEFLLLGDERFFFFFTWMGC